MTLDLKRCARCGADHDAVEPKPLTRPAEVAGVLYTHWLICPATGEPVLLRGVRREA